MKLRTWAFCLSEANQNLLKNPVPAIASVTTTAVSLLVLGVFLMLSMNINAIAANIESQVTVRAFYDTKATSTQEQAELQQVRGWSDVRNATIVTKDQELQNLKQEFGNQGTLLDSLGNANPLEDSLSVTARSPSAVSVIAKRLQGLDGIVHVNYQSDVVRRLFGLVNGVRVVGLGFGVLLALGSLLVIHNAIRLGIVARRREISIMRLVGATESLVHWPFILEGLLLGFIGSILAAGVAFWAYSFVFHSASRSLPFLPLLSPSPMAMDIALLLLVLGVVLGAVGYRLSLRRLARV